MHIRQIIEKAVNEIAAVANKIPAVTVIHDLRDWRVAWMSERGLKLLGLTQEEVKSLTHEEYNKAYFNEEDVKDYAPKVFGFLESNDDDKICTLFQQVRFKPHGAWTWHLSSLKILVRDNDGNPLLTITTSFPLEDMRHIAKKADRILEENNFLRKNFHLFSKLGAREQEVLKYWVLSKTSTEIAELMAISIKTVETHRKNIKTKLKTNSLYELTHYAHCFDLI